MWGDWQLYLVSGHQVEVRPLAVLRPRPDVMMRVTARKENSGYAWVDFPDPDEGMKGKNDGRY